MCVGGGEVGTFRMTENEQTRAQTRNVVQAWACVRVRGLTFLMFFTRSEPAQSMAKPACIMKTSAPCVSKCGGERKRWKAAVRVVGRAALGVVAAAGGGESGESGEAKGGGGSSDAQRRGGRTRSRCSQGSPRSACARSRRCCQPVSEGRPGSHVAVAAAVGEVGGRGGGGG